MSGTAQTAEPRKQEEIEPKLGLALSGGGFRAAFFHVGVLARMAELRVLARVTVISTVSGGSIVGALYYLKLRKLLQQEEPPIDEDYVTLVQKLARDLRKAVQRNLRARVFLNPFKNLEMLARTAYSRRDRIGDLLDRMFYRPTWGDPGNRRLPLTKRQIQLREIPPQDGRPAPQLVMNATCLNTGHSWHFEPEGMGEPAIDPRYDRVDRNERLVWGRFDQITSTQSDFPLGLAVAASGGFPVLVSPLSITGLYDGIRVRLMDGGAHDNQGIEALLGRVSALVVSDGAAQMEDEKQPHAALPSLLGRIIGIYGDRVREEQLAQLEWSDHALVHLREGLPRPVRYPLDDNQQPISTPPDEPGQSVPGIHEEAQRRLARVRTDLDAFNDVEIDSLMLDGYLIATAQLPPPSSPLEGNWIFMRVEDCLSSPPPAYRRKLSAASGKFFKSIHPRSVFGWIVTALLLVGAATALWLYRNALEDALLDVFGSIRLWRALGISALLALGPIVVGRLFALMLGPRLLARPGTSLAFVGRWTPIVAVVAASIVLVLVTFARSEPIGDRIDLPWPAWALALTTGLAFYGLALAPLVLSVAFWLDGKLYLHQGKLPRSDEVVEE